MFLGVASADLCVLKGGTNSKALLFFHSCTPLLGFPMSTTLYRMARLVLVAGVVVAVAAPGVMAQSGGSGGGKKKEKVELVVPTPPVGKSDIPWTPYGVAILLAGLIIGVNFIPSKRGHQD